MNDLIPTLIDGAVVFNLQNNCKGSLCCEPCTQLVLSTRNWIKQVDLNYVIFDFLDEKEICSTFLEELMALNKRLSIPFLFSGVMEKPQQFLQRFSYANKYPVFVTPEDAVRALRILHPGVTEGELKIDVSYGQSLTHAYKMIQQEQFSIF